MPSLSFAVNSVRMKHHAALRHLVQYDAPERAAFQAPNAEAAEGRQIQPAMGQGRPEVQQKEEEDRHA